LHIPSATLRYSIRPSGSLLTPSDNTRILFSFKNLIECYVLEGLRAHGVHLSSIRRALTFLIEKSESDHSFADYELKTDEEAFIRVSARRLQERSTASDRQETAERSD
jgi:DNA-binding transcriptional MerR regulator